MIKALIIEDEKNNSQRLKRLLEVNFEELEIVDIAETIQEAVEKITLYQPKLVFFDVELPDGMSFEIFEYFSEINFEVIFTTAYDKYALKAIKLSAIDFLIKPIELAELILAVNKALVRIKKNEKTSTVEFFKAELNQKDNNLSKIALPTMEGFQFVEIKDIIRCEAEGSYTNVYLLSSNKILVSKTLKDFEELLDEYNFCRVHHSHLINIAHILKYIKGEGGYVIMADNSEVDISRRKKEDFLARITKI